MTRMILLSLSLSAGLLVAGCAEDTDQPKAVEETVAIDVAENVPPFRANGNEPFWTIESAGDGILKYTTPELPEGRALYAEDASAYAKGVNIFGQDKAGNSFTIDLNGAACEDSMSGERYEMTISLNYDGRSSTGCANSL